MIKNTLRKKQRYTGISNAFFVDHAIYNAQKGKIPGGISEISREFLGISKNFQGKIRDKLERFQDLNM